MRFDFLKSYEHMVLTVDKFSDLLKETLFAVKPQAYVV